MTDEMILVPRAELLAWAQDWLRENDPGDGTDCVTPFDWHLLKTPVKAHCTTCSCVPGMTPAVRFDTTPAEKEGAVRDHLVRMGWTPPADTTRPRPTIILHMDADGGLNFTSSEDVDVLVINYDADLDYYEDDEITKVEQAVGPRADAVVYFAAVDTAPAYNAARLYAYRATDGRNC